MDAPNGEFVFARIDSIIFGPGRVAELARQLDSRGLKRALIITGNSLSRSHLLDRVKAALAGRVAAIFTGASQHVPSKAVAMAVEEARRSGADCIVSFGGGSPIDTGKAVAMALMGGKVQTRIDMGAPQEISAARTLPHFAVSTTLSAAEFTPAGGVTDEKTRLKGGVSDPRLVPRVAILDPELTTATPALLWSSTGIRALDHAVESAYSAFHQPLTDTLATRAIEILRTHLKPSLDADGDGSLAHRGHCQIGAWFSILGIMNVRSGISHALGHQIGPRWNVPHGVTSCITMPHVMRYMAEIAPERFGPIAAGFGVAFDPEEPKTAARECADRTAAFIAQFGAPTRLRDFGIKREELSDIAQTVNDEIEKSGAVGRSVKTGELVNILQSAY